MQNLELASVQKLRHTAPMKPPRAQTYLGFRITRGTVRNSLSVVYRVTKGEQWYGSSLSATEARERVRGLVMAASTP